MKRLFTAVKFFPDPDFLEAFRELRQAMAGEKIKWVEEQNIHITIKFLGETDERRIPEISGLLNHLADITPVFSFRLEGLGVFGSSYNPRVVWAGINPHHELLSLMKRVKQDFTKIGFPADRQNTVPHLTLGRIKFLRDRTFFQKTLDDFKQIESLPVTIREMILYESILHSSGPEYITTGTFPFKKNSPG